MKTISIVIPVYYNELSLPRLFKTLLQLELIIKKKGMGLELIFVDDGSGDSSFSELLKIKEQRPATKIIKLSRNFGSIRAIKTGFRFVTGDCFTFLAADLQDPPELIDQMVDKWLKGSKYIICTRTKRDDPLLSQLFSRLFYKLVRLFVVKDFPKGGFDLFLLDSSVLPFMLQSGKNINIALFTYSLGYKPEIIYYHRQKREFGKSRWTATKKFNYFIDSIMGFSIIPLRLVSIIGTLLALISFIYGLIVMLTVLISGASVPGFAALATLISFLCGLILIMLGIIGEYLWRIFENTNGTPETVIETSLLK
jgi:glycosyltransferase involved in cell wall biosynthesis